MWLLIVGITGLSVLGWFVNTYVPDNFWTIVLFFLIVAAMTFFSSLFLLKFVRRATLVTLGVIVWLILRILGLHDWYYPALLIPILISLEILFQNR